MASSLHPHPPLLEDICFGLGPAEMQGDGISRHLTDCKDIICTYKHVLRFQVDMSSRGAIQPTTKTDVEGDMARGQGDSLLLP